MTVHAYTHTHIHTDKIETLSTREGTCFARPNNDSPVPFSVQANNIQLRLMAHCIFDLLLLTVSTGEVCLGGGGGRLRVGGAGAPNRVGGSGGAGVKKNINGIHINSKYFNSKYYTYFQHQF